MSASGQEAAAGAMMSAYELARQQRIRENQAVMAQLGLMSSTRRQKRQNHPAAPSSNRNQSPPQMPFGCLRSADSIYELFERKTKIGRGQKCEVILTTSKSL